MAASCAVLLAALAVGCARPVEDVGAPLGGLHACPRAGGVVGVFTGQAATARPDDGPEVQGSDVWALSLDGSARRLTDDGVHVGGVIGPDARTAYLVRSSGRVLGESLEAPGVVERLDLVTGRVTDLAHLGGIVDLAVSADGRHLAVAHTLDARPGTGVDDNGVTLVDLTSAGSARSSSLVPDTGPARFSAVNEVALSPDGDRLAYAQAIEVGPNTVVQKLRIRDVTTDAEQVVSTAEGTDFFSDVAWSADGRTVIAAVRHQEAGDTVESPPRFRTLRYDVPGGRATVDEGHAPDVTPLSPDGGRLLGVASAARGRGGPTRALVAWDRAVGAGSPLVVGRGAHAISVAACTYR